MSAAEQYRTLEFDRLLSQLSGFAQSEPARDAILATEIDFAPASVDEKLDQTDEALRFASDNPAVDAPAYGQVADLRELLARIGLGETVATTEAKALLAFFDVSAQFDEYRQRLSPARYPRLAAAAEPWQPLDELRAHTRRIFNTDGEVRDNASSELNRIRVQLRQFEGEVKQLLAPVLKQVREDSNEEALITIRHHRFVVMMPRSELRHHRGSVVDVSSTGQSVYFEPQPLARANMDRQHLFLDEDAEVRRIMREYGQALSLRLPSLLSNLDVLVAFDCIHARTRYSDALRANRPAMSTTGGFILRRAVHPLLYRDFVPEDLTFDSERALVISGVNAGGKTVLLKLLGLYTLMAAAGCFVPGDAQLPYISGVCAYIGDEQSTQYHLSTFTAHLRFVKELWERFPVLQPAVASNIAAERSDAEQDLQHPTAFQAAQGAQARQPAPPSNPILVLIDEVGTGTEPSEGQAFAYGLISALLDKPVKLAVTTHFDLLKVLGLQRDDVKNVSLQFDQEQLKATYHVLDNQPGQSFALAIARRWGIAPEIIAGADGVLGKEERHMASVIAELERLREEAQAAQSQARGHAQEVERIKAQNEELSLELRRAKLRFAQQSEQLRTEVKRRIEELLSETKRKLKNKTRQIARKQDEYVKAASKTARVAAGQQSEAEELVDAMLAALEVDTPDQAVAAENTVDTPLALGDLAQVDTGAVRGEVAELHPDKGEAVLLVSGKRMTVKISRLRHAPSVVPRQEDALARYKPKGQQSPASGGGFAHSLRSDEVLSLELQDSSDTLDLHGKTVEEATEMLDEFISRALLNNLATVRIMHGVGSGRLRAFVQDYLKREKHVAGMKEAPLRDGGMGVTLADLV